jgi:hypothetical protein
MNANDVSEDPLIAALRELPSHDVSRRRAERLRARCHGCLRTPSSVRPFHSRRDAGIWRPLRVLASAWCVVYVFETVRRAVAIIGW